MNRYWLW